MIDPRDPVQSERPLFLIHQPMREPLGQRRTEHLRVVDSGRLIPPRQQEAGVVDVVVEVVVGESQMTQPGGSTAACLRHSTTWTPRRGPLHPTQNTISPRANRPAANSSKASSASCKVKRLVTNSSSLSLPARYRPTSLGKSSEGRMEP